MKPFEDNITVQLKYIASVIIERYYDLGSCGCGGSLHIVLDDKNISESDLEFCAKWADEHNDKMGGLICGLLLQLPLSEIEDVVYNWNEIANDIEL